MSSIAIRPSAPRCLAMAGAKVAMRSPFDRDVDDDVADVNPLRAELARHRLGDRFEPGLAGGELTKARASAPAGGRAGEQDRARAAPQHASDRFLADQQTAVGAHPPEFLEGLGLEFEERDVLVVAAL